MSQYVIVGAGLDTCALRHPELAGRLSVYELDHPDTQAFKRKRLALKGFALPLNLHFALVDFERETVADALRRTSYDPTLPALFAWHGVTMYLTLNSVETTLKCVASISPAGSEVVFDYVNQAFFSPDRQSPAVRALFQRVANVGEPWLTGFDPGGLGKWLGRLGFELVGNLGPEELNARYFDGRADGIRAAEPGYIAHARVI